jgi:imidazolonepropionase-like amidohydrolase
MKVNIFLIGLCLSLSCAGLAGLGTRGHSKAQSATSAGVKAYIGANIIDGTGKPAVENAALIVRDGKVEAVGPASKVKLPAGAQTINLAGKFIIPGLISAHVHVSDVQGLRPPAYTTENTLRQLGVFARYGVTTVLSLGGEKEPAFKLRDAQNTPSLEEGTGIQIARRAEHAVAGSGANLPVRRRHHRQVAGRSPANGRSRRRRETQHHQDSRRRQPRRYAEDGARSLSRGH